MLSNVEFNIFRVVFDPAVIQLGAFTMLYVQADALNSRRAQNNI